MSEPKYAIGQRVAVCNGDCSRIIPATEVLAVEFWRHNGGLPHPFRPGSVVGPWAGWSYLTNADAAWFREPSLRPIDDDEYKDTLQDEQPINTWRGKQHKSPEEIQRMVDNART